MHPLTDSDIVGVWERGMANQPVYRALILLAFACSEMTPEMLARLTIGQRDSLLLELRELAPTLELGSQWQGLGLTCGQLPGHK